jgi:chromosome partitioning protein
MPKQLSFTPNAEVISFIMNKGGTAKTTLMTNLAGVMHGQNENVLMIDMDSQLNASRSFKYKAHRFTSANMFDGVGTTQQMIVKQNGVPDMIQAHRSMGSLEIDLIPKLKRFDDPFKFVKPHVDFCRDKYDYILLDSPPSLGLTVGNILAASDYVIIPFKPEPYSVDGLEQVIAAIRDFNQYGHGAEVLAVVPTMTQIATNLHTKIMDQGRRYCYENDLYFSEAHIPRCIVSSGTIDSHGLPATMTNQRNHKDIVPYFHLWDELKIQLNLKKGVTAS